MIVRIIIIIYLCYLLVLFLRQRTIMYRPFDETEFEEFTHSVRNVEIPGTYRLKGLFYERNKDWYTVLFLHGNSGSLRSRIPKLNTLSTISVNYCIVAYRGFDGNDGRPTEEGLYDDGRSMMSWLNKNGIPSEKIVLYGESLGCCVALQLAMEQRVSGMILESSFRSMERVVQRQYPLFPTKLMLLDRYNKTCHDLKQITCPTLVCHSSSDTIVPMEMGKDVFQCLGGKKYFYRFDGGHGMKFTTKTKKVIESFLQTLDSENGFQ